MGTKPIEKDVYGENFDAFDLSHLQSAIKDYSDSEAQKDKMIDSIVRSSQRQKSQLYKVIESILNKLPSVDFVYFQCLPNINSYLSFLSGQCWMESHDLQQGCRTLYAEPVGPYRPTGP